MVDESIIFPRLIIRDENLKQVFGIENYAGSCPRAGDSLVIGDSIRVVVSVQQRFFSIEGSSKAVYLVETKL